MFFHDRGVAKSLDYLIQRWPTLHPFDEEHRHTAVGIERKGDAIEICLAALRADTLFEDAIDEQLAFDGLTFPIVYQQLCDLCVLVQYMDASMCT